jgi:hypothetical protein
MKRFLTIVFIVSLAATRSAADDLLAFCDLLKNPESYNGKEMTVRATYKYGFEWQQLYCLDCLNSGKAWIEFEGLDERSVNVLKLAPKDAGTVNVTVQGTFVSGDHYGHQNMYRYKFVAHRASNLAVIVRGMKNPAEEEKAETMGLRWNESEIASGY